jgi:uncharacterized membrane protein YeaQ/YmgE (transglycosylase-associated protein family)
METLLWIVLGLAAGVVAMVIVYRSIPRTAWGWVGALAVGLLGGWAGGLVTDLIGLEIVSWLGAFVVALVGAWALLALIRRMLPARA